MAERQCSPLRSRLRVGCEDSRFRFLAAAYGRINSTWTLPNQVGSPIAKELLFSARVVEAEEAYRIGLLNHLVPREQLRAKTMELARMIAGNNRGFGDGHQDITARADGAEPRTAMEQRAALHDACRERRQGGINVNCDWANRV
jgi:enoyl-CoA hydratase/carnithine racemase